MWLERDQHLGATPMTSLGEELLQNLLRLVVRALAVVMMTNPPLRIDEVERWPRFVVEGAPDRMVAVHHDRVCDAHGLGGAAHVVDSGFEPELRRLHSDHHQPTILVLLRPGPDVGQLAN